MLVQLISSHQTGMVVVLSRFLVRPKFLLTLVYLELDPLRNLAVRQRQLHSHKKQQIYSRYKVLVILPSHLTGLVKVHYSPLLVLDLPSLLHSIHQKTQFYSILLELLPRDIFNPMLEKAYSSLYKQRLRNLYLTM